MLVAPGMVIPAVASTARTLTNLDYLNWLRDQITPPGQRWHTTYRLDRQPAIGVLWTYAERDPAGGYRRLGGGRHDPTTGWYGQGAFNADDMARAAVVYLRHWCATGAADSRHAAYELLRGLAYLQTGGGPHAGNVVLWMQPDGTLNPSADPVEPPDPSDSADSCWLARSIWAFGEGYAAFRLADPGFAAFLRARLTLALDAVERQVLVRYGRWRRVDGVRVPAWLVNRGADATGEALLGLAAYVEATGDERARRALYALAEGAAAMRATALGIGGARRWPFGAVLPTAEDVSIWRAWAGLAPAGLARAYAVCGNLAAREAACIDAGSFTPHILVTAGPVNAWRRDPGAGDPIEDEVQIAYGAQARVESLLSVARSIDRPGLVALAGIAAAWFFGNNPAGEPVYEPSTGRTFDGIDVPGVVHHDSGAESTIHGLLAMLALDAYPEASTVARTATVHERHSGLTGTEVLHDGDNALEWLTLARPGTAHGTALVRSFAVADRRVAIQLPGDGPALVRSFDGTGRVLRQYTGVGKDVVVPGGGFSILVRTP